jgi:hypothetical protein
MEHEGCPTATPGPVRWAALVSQRSRLGVGIAGWRGGKRRGGWERRGETARPVRQRRPVNRRWSHSRTGGRLNLPGALGLPRRQGRLGSAAARHGPGGSSSLQNWQGRAAPGLEGSIPSPRRRGKSPRLAGLFVHLSAGRAALTGGSARALILRPSFPRVHQREWPTARKPAPAQIGWSNELRSVTPEVAGSSPIAPGPEGARRRWGSGHLARIHCGPCQPARHNNAGPRPSVLKGWPQPQVAFGDTPLGASRIAVWARTRRAHTGRPPVPEGRQVNTPPRGTPPRRLRSPADGSA